jgi:hypothetical protein
MATNPFDGQFALELWEDPESENAPDHNEYSDNQDELRALIQPLLKGGRYKYIILCRWNPTSEEWDEIETFTEEDLED